MWGFGLGSVCEHAAHISLVCLSFSRIYCVCVKCFVRVSMSVNQSIQLFPITLQHVSETYSVAIRVSVTVL